MQTCIATLVEALYEKQGAIVTFHSTSTDLAAYSIAVSSRDLSVIYLYTGTPYTLS